MDEIKFIASFEKLVKDHEGEVTLILKVPLTEEYKVRDVPILTELDISIKPREE